MNLFKSFTLKWWQGGIFKWAMISLGILIGLAWPETLFPLWPLFLVIFVVATTYITWLWWKQ